jgi:hypothetical protein
VVLALVAVLDAFFVSQASLYAIVWSLLLSAFLVAFVPHDMLILYGLPFVLCISVLHVVLQVVLMLGCLLLMVPFVLEVSWRLNLHGMYTSHLDC